MLPLLSAVLLLCTATAVVSSVAALDRTPNASTIAAASHSFSLGAMRQEDSLLFTERVIRKAGRFWQETFADVEFPRWPQSPRGMLHYIVVTDRTNKDKGGYAHLVSGGVNSDHVKFHIKSQMGYGLDFNIDAYGF